MRFSVSFSVLACMAASVLAQNAPIVIDTPANPVQCQTTLVTWTGGSPPFDLVFVHDRTAEHHTVTSGNSFLWTVDLPANTDTFVSILDGTSHTGQSDLFLIQPSTDNSCLQQ
ncbi:uncharacterized protein TRAVEDRAFT_75492 [Trametes versicolor FP-101664 SS1]|uniref:Uncharacterized protein n=1 Tax=Trametes versicolor (strain FP-101664) TaxID=717944 RepID=R7S7U3_TRAVS|nr:uncharacterized protein TRAVEDRAFT_75492 [Trametes versicolor FP-101664 SS1]EIW52123.1 hypothetical protein TRAVEDRAFT_75492 [Trametes versicolor FP-101664 SS1]